MGYIDTNKDGIDFDLLKKWSKEYANKVYAKDPIKKEICINTKKTLGILGNYITYELNKKSNLIGIVCRSWTNVNGTKIRKNLWYEMRFDITKPFYITITIGENYEYFNITLDVIRNKLRKEIYYNIYNNYLKEFDFKDEYLYEPCDKIGNKIGEYNDYLSASQHIDGSKVYYVRIIKPIKVEITNLNKDSLIKEMNSEIKKFMIMLKNLSIIEG